MNLYNELQKCIIRILWQEKDDIKLKDMLRAIEAGEIEEDLDLPDPEEYDNMGGYQIFR
jgi:hypothetical protein